MNKKDVDAIHKILKDKDLPSCCGPCAVEFIMEKIYDLLKAQKARGK